MLYNRYDVSPRGVIFDTKNNNAEVEQKAGIDGYKFVTLYTENDTPAIHPVHRLVAKKFVPNNAKFRYVLHRDGDVQNNKVNNLVWIVNPPSFTPEYSEVGLFTEIQKRWHSGMAINDIGLAVGCHPSVVRDVLSGSTQTVTAPIVTMIYNHEVSMAHANPYLVDHKTGEPIHCRRVHGHTWIYSLKLKGAIHPQSGILIELGELKSIIKRALLPYEHNLILADSDDRFVAIEDATPIVYVPVAPSVENLANILTIAIRDELKESKYYGLKIKMRLQESPALQAETEWLTVV